MNFTYQEIIYRVKARIGWQSRCIPLREGESSGEVDHYQEAIEAAIDQFNEKIHRRESACIVNCTETQKVVDLSSDLELLRVSDVEFTRDRPIDSYGDDPFILEMRMPGARYPRSTYRGGSPPDTLLEYLAHRELVQQVTSTEPDWLWDGNHKRLSLFMPLAPYDVTYTKLYPYTIETLPESFKGRFIKAVEGHTRMILANILGRFGNTIPGPTGPIENDGSYQMTIAERLISETDQWLERLPLTITMTEG